MDLDWGRIKEAGRDLLGKLQGDVSFGDDGVSGRVSFGERRVMSVGALALVLALGFPIGKNWK